MKNPTPSKSETKEVKFRVGRTVTQLVLFCGVSLFLLCCNNPKRDAGTRNETSIVMGKAKIAFPEEITIRGIAQNPEGIEYDNNDQTFLLSSLNAGPIIKVHLDGTYEPFTTGEPFPMSTAGLHVDRKHNRLLVAAFSLPELIDNDPKTKGAAHLRIYDLKTGRMQKDVDLATLLPGANAYFANDVAVDGAGNVYVSDWYARVVYKVDTSGKPGVFWKNETGISSGANGLDVHPDGYLLVSLVRVNDQGLYTDYGLVNIPLSDPSSAKLVDFPNGGYAGFDGMVLNAKGNVVGVTNNGKSPGGNTLVELSSKDNWKSAQVIHSKAITPSTTVATTPEGKYYIINQDFTKDEATTWTIQQIEW